MSRVLITGIAGFLGSHLADKLLAEGHEVFGVDNLTGGYVENIPKGVTIRIPVDTSNIEEMKLCLKRWKPDVVYHLACCAYEGLSVFSPAFIVQNTLQNTMGILSASIQQGIKRFIFTSSMSRYGNHLTPFVETMVPKPVDPYGVAKVAAEQIIQQMAETHKFEYAIAVPHNIIGVRQKYDDPYRNVASIMINLMLQGKQPTIYGDGTQRRSFSYVGDCVDTMAKLIDCPSGEIYNIGPDQKNGTMITVNELYATIADLLDFTKPALYVPDRPREVKDAWCSSEKIRQQFGFVSHTPLVTVLKRMIKDIFEKGTKPFEYDTIPLEITHGAPSTWVKRTF